MEWEENIVFVCPNINGNLWQQQQELKVFVDVLHSHFGSETKSKFTNSNYFVEATALWYGVEEAVCPIAHHPLVLLGPNRLNVVKVFT